MKDKRTVLILSVVTILGIVVIYKEAKDHRLAPTPSVLSYDDTRVAPEETATTVETPAQEKPVAKKEQPDAKTMPEKRFARFLSLQEKALSNQDEKRELEQILSNPEVFRLIERTLLLKDPSHFTREGQRKRFNALLYIEKALAWEENPVQSELICMIERIIRSPEARTSVDARKAGIGDKLELYTMLRAISPATAEAILNRSHGTHLEKILDFAIKRLTF